VEEQENLMRTQASHTLPQIVDELSIRFYDSMESHCDNIDTYIRQLQGKELFLEHVSYCLYLAAEIRDLIGERRLVYVPYLNELSEKSGTGHDCANCSGGCDMQHTLKLVELSSSMKKMQSTSSFIQKELAALKKNRENADESLVWLENEIKLLTGLLDALFLHEEEILVPAIRRAQKNINAHS
jgi:hypothetical protein